MSGRVSGVLNAMGFHLGQEQKRQIIALDSEFKEMETQITTLKAENLNLRAQVKPLEEKVKRLQEQVKEKSAPQSHERLDEGSEKILIAVVNGADRQQAVAQVNISKAKGDYLFDILYERTFVESSFGMLVPTPQGRAYLAKHGLL